MRSEHKPVIRAAHGEASNDRLRARLLYVEDNLQVADITCLMLEDIGLDIVHAGSAEQALKIADESAPFDIVLTDVVMPGLSGVQLARRLNQRWPDIPIVLTSGYSDELAAGYGAQYELLRKPFTRGILLDCLHRHLDGPVYQNA